MKVGVRVDVDTLRDCETLPLVLNLLCKHHAKATFFLTTGYDRAGLNAANYLHNPMALHGIGLRKRYGAQNLLLSLLKPAKVEEAVDICGLIKGGHEVALHGYEHVSWIRDFNEMSSEELANHISMGLKAFEHAAKILPSGFASPGFMVNNKLLMALEDFGFHYSSDYSGSKPFYPTVDGRRLRTLQIPVNIDLELMSVGEDGLKKFKKRTLRKDGLMTMYFHPSYAYLNYEIVDRILELLEASRFLTFQEIADENTAYI